MQSRSLQLASAGSTIVTVPNEFIPEIGIPNWIDRTGSTDYTVWVTWLDDRNAVSYYFPDPNDPEQLEAAIPQQLLVRRPDTDKRCYQLTIPTKILKQRGITDEVINDGYNVFPETSADKRLLTSNSPGPRNEPIRGAISMKARQNRRLPTGCSKALAPMVPSQNPSVRREEVIDDGGRTTLSELRRTRQRALRPRLWRQQQRRSRLLQL